MLQKLDDLIKNLSDIILKDKDTLDELEDKTGNYYTEAQKQFQDANESFQKIVLNEIENTEINIITIINTFSKYIESIVDLHEAHKNIPMVIDILGKEQCIIMTGKNGVGKSRFIDDLIKNSIIKTYSMPAQKIFIYVESKNLNNIAELKNKFTDQRLKENEDDNFAYLDSFYLFTFLIKGIIKEHNVSKSDVDEPKESVLDKINKYFTNLFPHLKLKTDSDKGTLFVENSLYEEKATYGINSLSDGEKSVLFYLGAIFLNDNNHIYVIDEPETHLHMALAIELWDLILEEKKNSKFIFISHNHQFILTRKNSRILWCKEYKDLYKNNIIHIKEKLPKEILLELMGTDKSILFCEGTKNSLDFRIYNILYSENYYIIPVGGHKQVIEYTRAINDSNSIVNLEAIGLIDKDFHNKEKLDKYKEDNIYHIPYNEIEMLLMEKVILEKVLANAPKDIKVEDIEKIFREFLIKDMNISKQAGLITKYRLENEIQINKIVDEDSSKNEIEKILENLNHSKNWFLEEKNKLLSLYDSPNTKYEDLLEKCSFKNEITKGIMNKYENSYEERAIKILSNDNEIKEYLIERISIPCK